MLKYDYVIERDEKDTLVTYKPTEIPTQLPNLVYIEGPNSSGKSTLLHFIALACHGLKNDNIRPSLREKMRNLLEGKHQKITFKVEITDQSNRIVLSSEKKGLDNANIILRDGFKKIISADQFYRDYVLLYDIPENPTTRLRELLQEVQSLQVLFENKISILRGVITKVISDVQQARDPNRIMAVRTEIAEFDKKKNKIEMEITSLEERYKQIRLYSAVKFYTQYTNFLHEMEKKKREINKGEKEVKKKRQKLSKEYQILAKEKHAMTAAIKMLFVKLTITLQDFFGKGPELNRFNLWKKADVEKELDSPDLNSILRTEGLHFLKLLEDMREQHEKQTNFKQAQVLRDMINLLENYSDVEIKIPAADMTISKFIDALKLELTKHEKMIYYSDKIQNCANLLRELLGKREYVIDTINSKIDQLDEKKDEIPPLDEESEDDRIEKLDEQIKYIGEKIEYYQAECAKLDLKDEDVHKLYSSIVLSRAMKDLDNYDELHLKEKLSNMERDITVKKRDVSKIEANFNYLRKELEQLEKKEPHQYQNNLQYLKDTLLKQIQQIEYSMANYRRYVEYLLKSKKYDDKDDKKDREAYFNKVFDYLARRIGSIRHIDKDYEIRKINLIEQEIITKSGKIIKIADLGTGQSQSAYLMGLLNIQDNKKIIALFDEVAMMDDESLAPIKNRLNELYRSGKLLIGIIVQKANELKVQSLIKG